MSIKKEEVIQSVTINGVTLSTLTGVVMAGTRVESALKKIKAECEKKEIIVHACKMASILMNECENSSYTPNINYLASCLIHRNETLLMNWLLTIAHSIVKPSTECPDFLYFISEHFLFLLEDFVNGHS